MKFEAIIDLVKYTLALAAGCFVYALEKLVPAPTEPERWFVLVLLVLFVVSTIFGILIFSAATAAMHGDPQRAARQPKRIERFAWVHLGCLVLGVILLGGKLVDRVLTAPPLPPHCEAQPACPQL